MINVIRIREHHYNFKEPIQFQTLERRNASTIADIYQLRNHMDMETANELYQWNNCKLIEILQSTQTLLSAQMIAFSIFLR